MRGAAWPWKDLGRDHGTPLEGYYWRITDATRGRVIVALCGVVRSAEGRWGMACVASEPGGLVRTAITEDGRAGERTFGVDAGAALVGDLRALRARPTDDTALDIRLSRSCAYHGRALGPAYVLPGLPQYWAPLVLGARVDGSARLGGEEIDLTGATAYVERTWGTAFPARWWWGQADAFEGADVCVAFAGGELAAGICATAAVVRVGRRIVRFPLAVGRGWSLRARFGRYAVRVEGDAAGQQPAVLPVPVAGERRVEARSHHWLAGRLHVVVTHRGRVLYRGESPLAGLEHGIPHPARRGAADPVTMSAACG